MVGLHHLRGAVEQGGQVQHHSLEEELEDHLQIEYAVCFSVYLGCLQLELSLLHEERMNMSLVSVW